ncbi:hypothetical protein [Bradyrhizobium sp. NFR13]|jgi:hypothetical protein|uniref:hypothetical protein n=1 Tax=Bradyrhizobium sp. NFR13 TaxID=1566285 RepID=UPI000B873C02|nr:hypothetical protein [Bradyrhizobium sp. NFR13]
MAVLSKVSAFPGGKPFEPLWKGLDIAQKAGARDDGPTGPISTNRQKKSEGDFAVIVRSAPGRDLRIGALYGFFQQWQAKQGQMPGFRGEAGTWILVPSRVLQLDIPGHASVLRRTFARL